MRIHPPSSSSGKGTKRVAFAWSESHTRSGAKGRFPEGAAAESHRVSKAVLRDTLAGSVNPVSLAGRLPDATISSV